MQQIINSDSLLEDMIEGVSELLDRPLSDKEMGILRDSIEDIIDSMFQAESESIFNIYTQLKGK